jgi:hypothetical protein
LPRSLLREDRGAVKGAVCPTSRGARSCKVQRSVKVPHAESPQLRKVCRSSTLRPGPGEPPPPPPPPPPPGVARSRLGSSSFTVLALNNPSSSTTTTTSSSSSSARNTLTHARTHARTRAHTHTHTHTQHIHIAKTHKHSRRYCAPLPGGWAFPA